MDALTGGIPVSASLAWTLLPTSCEHLCYCMWPQPYKAASGGVVGAQWECLAVLLLQYYLLTKPACLHVARCWLPQSCHRALAGLAPCMSRGAQQSRCGDWEQSQPCAALLSSNTHCACGMPVLQPSTHTIR